MSGRSTPLGNEQRLELDVHCHSWAPYPWEGCCASLSPFPFTCTVRYKFLDHIVVHVWSSYTEAIIVASMQQTLKKQLLLFYHVLITSLPIIYNSLCATHSLACFPFLFWLQWQWQLFPLNFLSLISFFKKNQFILSV